MQHDIHIITIYKIATDKAEFGDKYYVVDVSYYSRCIETDNIRYKYTTIVYSQIKESKISQFVFFTYRQYPILLINAVFNRVKLVLKL